MYRYLVMSFMFFVLPIFSYAEILPISPIRNSEEQWEDAIRKQLEVQNFSSLELLRNISHDTSIILNVASLPEWKRGLPALISFAEKVRVLRKYTNPNPGNFRRRAPWLFPVDGCYAKAAHISAVASSMGHSRPGKVFAFGNLQYSTPFARNGRITYWSYHMAASYRIGSVVYVIDPTITSKKVMPLVEWVKLISKEPQGVRVKLCDANSYSPYSKCLGGRGNGAYLGHMRGVLQQEWSHLIKLGYSPDAMLGPGAR